MLSKAGIVTVGVTVSLLAAAPIAWAGDKHHHHHGHHAVQKVDAENNTQCAAASGANAGAGGSGTSPAGFGANSGIVGAVTGGAVTGGAGSGGNAGQSMSCNSYLNHNFDNNTIYVIPPAQK